MNGFKVVLGRAMPKKAALFSQAYERLDVHGTGGAVKCDKVARPSIYLEIPTLRTHSLLAKLCVPHDREYGESQIVLSVR